MKQSKPYNKDSSRRRSWLNGASNIFSLFSSNHSSESIHQKQPISRPEIYTQPSLSDPYPSKSSSHRLSNIFSKATKKHHRKYSTATQDSDITTAPSTPQYQSSSLLFEDTGLPLNFSRRRSSSKSEATVLSDTINDTKSYVHPQQFSNNSSTKTFQLMTFDEEEFDRIQLKNDLVKLAFEGEFSLPFDYRDVPNAQILDIGCGPGSWCIDLAQKYPQIHVIGIDSSDMFPSEHSIPPNCKLLVSDAISGLKEFHDASFDVIHIRFMNLAFTVSQYLKVIKDCWRLLKPGGYIEILESDLIVYSAGPTTSKVMEEISDVIKSMNYDPEELTQLIPDMISATGLNTQIKYRSIPLGIWGGRIGVLCKEDMLNLINKFQSAINQYYGKSEKEIVQHDSRMTIVAKEVEQYHSYTNYYFYSSQKPPNLENRGLPNSVVTTLPNQIPALPSAIPTTSNSKLFQHN